jgi:hypothetical protein
VESVLTTRPRQQPIPRLPAPRRAPRESLAVRAPWGVITATVLIALWMILAPQTPDLAGQVYRAGLFERAGFVLWDNRWYAGHHVPGYSLTWPWLASLVGVRVSGALAVLASAYLFERLARALYGPRTTAAAIWFAVAASADAWIGRLTFALGVTLALAAALVLVRGLGGPRRAQALAATLAALAALTSPVAGLLLVLALCSWALGAAIAAPAIPGAHGARATAASFAYRLRPMRALVIAPVVVVVVLEALFPEGGFEPYAASSIIAALAVTVAFMLALPRDERVLRIGAGVYALVNLLCLIPITPMGSNIQRYGVLLAGPLLLCVLGSRGGVDSSRLPRPALAVALAGMALWVLWGPVGQTLEVSGDPSTRAAFYAPVERFLAQHRSEPVRIEVPFTRAHWEAAFLAPDVSLARGWERQLDKRYDLVLESHHLDAAAYRAWLDREGVSYVALPDVAFDQSSSHEVRLLRAGLPYLREVMRSAHWRIFGVLDPSPLALRLPGSRAGARSAAGVRLTALGVQSFALSVSTPGRFLVKVHYSPYWTVTRGAASVRSGPQGFTEVRASRPGEIAVAARFSLAGVWRALP